jgi:hypothetical protein
VTDFSDKEWAKKANALQFEQLDKVRAVAGNWRTALIGLTSLFTAVAVIKGRENIAELTDSGRLLVVILAGAAFFLLVAGSLLASWAAFGMPGGRDDRYITGQYLAAWEKKEAKIARLALKSAQVVFVIGLACIGVATGVTWINNPKEPPAQVALDVGKEKAECGELLRMNASGVTLKTKGQLGEPKETTFQLADIRSAKLIGACPK